MNSHEPASRDSKVLLFEPRALHLLQRPARREAAAGREVRPHAAQLLANLRRQQPSHPVLRIPYICIYIYVYIYIGSI